jgi:hypothetical protein
MNLATLNKQRSTEKQQPQSIKTTVTISKVSKTPQIGSTSPIMNKSKMIASLDGVSQSSAASSDSPQTVREASDDIPFADESSIGKKKELAKEKFMNEGVDMSRRGEFSSFFFLWCQNL